MDKTSKLAWTPLHHITHGNVVVNINICKGYRDRYSIDVAKPTPNSTDRTYTKHFGIFIETENGQAVLKRSIASFAYEAIKEAEDWILARCQAREAEILNERIERDTLHAEQDLNTAERERQHKRGLK